MTPLPPQKFFLPVLNRRRFLMAGTAAALLGLMGCINGPNICAAPQSGLQALAAQKRKIFGASVHSKTLARDHRFACAVARECGVIVAETQMKWDALQPREGEFNFSGYDALATYARANNLQLRGHAFVWHRAMPQWLKDKLAAKQGAQNILATHITTVMNRTKGFVRDWDVVNEAVHEKSSRADKLRETPWLQALGPNYIADAFVVAHKADPHARLVYNDYGIEYADAKSVTKRNAVLQLLRQLKEQNVPVHALGLQSHLDASRPMGGAGFARFLADVRALGIEVIVTEFDVGGGKARKGIAEQDRPAIYANYAGAYLDLVQQGAPLRTLIAWGLSDRYSWLTKEFDETNGMLPLDAGLQPAALHDTLKKHWLKA